MESEALDEIVFQVLLGRMNKKKRYAKPITQEDITSLLQNTRSVLTKEPILLELEGGIVIVGDLHGNVDDLIRIFERLRYPPATRYLFLGDYVDRGIYGLEVMLLLFALKVKFPDNVFLLRGNHECASLTGVYGFEEEILEKFNREVYNEFIETFYQLPMCAVVGERIFCVHGGISPDLVTLDDIKKLEKPREIPMSGLVTDLVWSDPDIESEDFTASRRGCGYLYGPEALDDFLANNELDLLVRSHELCDEGVCWPYQDDDVFADSCITVFSNTDYCGRENSGAVICVTDDLTVSIEVFEPLLVEETKRNILLPYWLADLISKKEAERAKCVNRNATLAENKNTITNGVDAVKQKSPLSSPKVTRNEQTETQAETAAVINEAPEEQQAVVVDNETK